MVKENKTEKKQPAYKIKKGAIDGTVWANEKEGTKGKFTSYSVNIEKSFTRDEHGKNQKDTSPKTSTTSKK